MNNRCNKNVLKKTFDNSNNSLYINNQNYSNFGNQMSANQLLYNNGQSETLDRNFINNN